ncbi:sensor histidine kinase [Nonomuraea sp. NPDC050451]|uniref:sensor histidine kinase n=1 Tax=Nonomuraea sp. NPDC050451 TaxID=3364364 RepID=UPI00379214A8
MALNPAGVLVWFVCASWVIRVTSHLDRGTDATVVVAGITLVVLLQLPISLPGRRWVPRGVLLAAQAVCNYLPLLITPQAWWTGASAFVAGSVLLVVRGPLAWPLFVLISALEGVTGVLLGREPVDVYHMSVAPITLGLMLYGLSHLADLLARVRQERGELAARAEEVERLRLWRHTRGLLLTGLSTIEELAERARRHEGEAARELTAQALTVARRTLDRMRSLPASRAAVPSPLPAGDRPILRLATPVLVVVHLIFMGQAVFNATTGDAIGTRAGLALLPVTFGLQLWHLATARSGARPRHWAWTMALQALATYLPVALGGESGLIVSGFLGGLVLLHVAAPASWALCAVIVGVSLVDGVLRWDPVSGVYAGCSTLSVALAVYGLTRLAALVTELRRTRAQLVEMAALQERLKVGRDVHDLLGRGLTAITLHAELVLRLLGADPPRAAEQLARLAETARASAAEVTRLSGPRGHLSLAGELDSARAALESAGARVRVTADRVPAALDALLAVVLREAVTNVLRHSTPAECHIEVATEDGRVRLRVANDGVPYGPPEDGPQEDGPQEDGPRASGPQGDGLRASGSGLRNLRTRLQDAAGELVTERTPGRFELRADLPADHEILIP